MLDRGGHEKRELNRCGSRRETTGVKYLIRVGVLGGAGS